jgi:hypothetical protein
MVFTLKLVLYTILALFGGSFLIFAVAYIREGFGALAFAKKIRAAEIKIYGNPKNKMLNLWWYVFSGPGVVTIQDSKTGDGMVVRRAPK